MDHVHSIACLCQGLAEDEGKDYLSMVVSLPDGEFARRFQLAAEEIELMLTSARCRIVDFRVSPVPPVDQLPGQGTLAGIVIGPKRSEVTDFENLNFFGEVLAILEAHDLKEDPPEPVN